MAWTEADIPALEGRTAVVTGANSGLGFETSRALAARGARVILACRNLAKAEGAAAAIRARASGAKLEILQLDLASLASVEAFADTLIGRGERLDLLINNAGVMALPLARTADGFEMQIGANHLGHFALTGRLLDTLTPAARVVNVSSFLHKSSKGLDFSDLNWTKRPYQTWSAYHDSKLANLLFTFELARRAKAAGKSLVAAAAHPGFSDTNLQFVAAEIKQSKVEAGVMRIVNSLLAQKAEKGALPTLYAATAPGVVAGDFYGPDGFSELWGSPIKAAASARANDAEAARRLWELSEQLTGVRYLQA